ncbi:MAG: hypothetical protein A2Y94_08065 [Caldithrix sp. RBG_13_44_9]|nr:MAG: hypothetical protein A2Y94_08065 [Caldithrix sp. RBG_13_44_9]
MTRGFISFIIFILTISLSLAGNISQVEKQLETEIFEHSLLQKKLDSLRITLERYARQIESEKKLGTVEEKKIRGWFEEINGISREINLLEKKSQTLQQKILQTRTRLDTYYSEAIDSLQELSRQTSEQQKLVEINELILDYTAKRISVLPAFTAFSFDPQKITGISLRETRDSLEYAIYLDYLTNARKEVKTILHSIEITRKELDDLLWLQQRSNRFLEELDENRPMALFSQTSSSDRTAQPTFGSNELSEGEKISMQTQTQSLFNLLNQLPGETSNYSWTAPLDSGRVYLTLEDYRKTLQDAEKFLKNYQKLLDHKINFK